MEPANLLAFTGDDVVKFIILGGGMIVAITAILGGYISGTMRASARERTRREIAAYVAEGSISPEQGERMMRIAGTENEKA